MVGLRAPVSGQVRILGLDPRREHAGLAPRLGVMPQDGGVYAGARPIEVLRLVAAFHADPDDPVALLERVGLSHRAQAQWRTLSGGEQQRLSLALALVGRPEVVFLDEPTAGIDPSGRLLVRQLIADLRTAGLAVVVTTHDLALSEVANDPGVGATNVHFEDRLEDGQELEITLNDMTLHTGSFVANGQWWTEPVPAATVTVAVDDIGAGG